MIGVSVPPLADDLTAQAEALIAISAIAGAIAPRTVRNRAREGLIATSEPSGERPRSTRPCILGSASAVLLLRYPLDCVHLSRKITSAPTLDEIQATDDNGENQCRPNSPMHPTGEGCRDENNNADHYACQPTCRLGPSRCSWSLKCAWHERTVIACA
jgi:hypothetical protein